MILAWLIITPALGDVLAWQGERLNPEAQRWIALLALAAELALLIALWAGGQGGTWLAQTDWRWIPQIGISFHLALDGLSLVLILLTMSLGILSVAVSWTEITESIGFFHLNLLFTLAGVSSSFLVFGIALLYNQIGTMVFAATGLAALHPTGLSRIYWLTGLAMILTGIGFKLSLVPFHL